jgi:hypothetical protein
MLARRTTLLSAMIARPASAVSWSTTETAGTFRPATSNVIASIWRASSAATPGVVSISWRPSPLE